AGRAGPRHRPVPFTRAGVSGYISIVTNASRRGAAGDLGRDEVAFVPAPGRAARSGRRKEYSDGWAERLGHPRYPAGAAAARPGRPASLGGVRRALRPARLRLVPALGSAGGRCPGRDAERPAATGRQDEGVLLRPGAELPRLAQDSDPALLERLR